MIKTVFVGGSRHVSRLPAFVRDRLDAIVEQRHRVLIGDANGADKAVQRHFADVCYPDLVVFCSGEQPRNNVGEWSVRNVDAAGAKGFQFYAAKDRAMAREADAGLMIWDGKSAGTLLNVLRLAQAGKKTVLATVPDRDTLVIRSDETWRNLFDRLSPTLKADLRDRATASEWTFAEPDSAPQFDLDAIDERQVVDRMNEALRVADAEAFLASLATLRRGRGHTGRHDEPSTFSDVLRDLTALGIGVRIAAGRRAA